MIFKMIIAVAIMSVAKSCYLQNCYGKRFFIRKESLRSETRPVVLEPSPQECPSCLAGMGECRGRYTCCSNDKCIFSMNKSITGTCRDIIWTEERGCEGGSSVRICRVDEVTNGICTVLGMCCSQTSCATSDECTAD